MTASLKESGNPPAASLHSQAPSANYSKRDSDFVRVLNAAGLASELDAERLSAIAADLGDSGIDARRMDILEVYYRGDDDPTVALRRRASDRFFMHNDYFSVNAHQMVASLSSLNPEIATVELQRIGADNGPLVLRAGENFSAISDEEDEDSEAGTVAVRALVRAMNSLLAKAGVSERLGPLVYGESRELYVGVTEDGAMALLQSGCTELSAAAALREFASW
ncbi:MAG: hypothetical protein ACN4G0_15425 [Polyangiales bacterium]